MGQLGKRTYIHVVEPLNDCSGTDLDEAIIEAQVVTNAVLPPLSVVPVDYST